MDVEEAENAEEKFDEEEVLTYYFYCGYSYNEILLFLEKYHNFIISYSTLLRRLRGYGLRRRCNENSDQYQNSVVTARERIQAIINGPGSLCGYRSVWHTLEMEGLRIPRSVVQALLKEIDPEGATLRRRRRLRRREYQNPGPNYAWHIDGYDKLKPWGFPVHGSIDGFSRRVLWLKVTRSNSSPDVIASMYLNTVKDVGGCPLEMVTDLGTENGIAAAIQCYFRNNDAAHRYVPSPRNQRIEGWWSYFSKSYSTWWRNFFHDLEFRGVVDMSMELSKECLWYCFSPLIQSDLDIVKAHWNTHSIRRSRHNTVAGRPDALFYLPELNRGVGNLLLDVPQRDIRYVAEHIVEVDQSNEYTEYFDMVAVTASLSTPRSWQEALGLYNALLQAATG